MAADTASDAAAAALIARFLAPRMTAEHLFSGGGTCLSVDLRPMLPGRRFAGRALTVQTLPGFTRRPIEALARAKPGDVLVIAAGGKSEYAPWGSIVHWNAKRSGMAGVVIDGMLRDLLEIRDQEDAIPAFARGPAAAIAGFGPPSIGSIGETVICGGAAVSTGDVIFGDDDGLVVVPWAKAESVLDLALKSIVFDDKEQAWVESGRSVYDLLLMLSGKDGASYKERKFRWTEQKTLDPLAD